MEKKIIQAMSGLGIRDTLPETNSSPLKINGWKMKSAGFPGSSSLALVLMVKKL